MAAGWHLQIINVTSAITDTSGDRNKGGGSHQRVLVEGEDYRRAWLQQVAYTAGGADGALEHRRGLRFQRVQEPARGTVRGGPDADRDHLQHQHRDAGSIGRGVRHVGGTRGAARGDVHRRPVLVWWVRHRGTRGGDVAVVAGVSRIRGGGRHRARHRLHLTGLDFDQVVPRPAWPGHRPRNHGLWGRRADRLAALEHVARNLRQQPGECDRALVPDAGRYLSGLDDDRRVRGAPARGGLSALKLDASRRGGDRRPADHRRRVGEQRDPHAAVLDVVDRALL